MLLLQSTRRQLKLNNCVSRQFHLPLCPTRLQNTTNDQEEFNITPNPHDPVCQRRNESNISNWTARSITDCVYDVHDRKPVPESHIIGIDREQGHIVHGAHYIDPEAEIGNIADSHNS